MSRGSGYRQPSNWEALKRDVLHGDPLCYLCHRRPAITADHIVNVARGGTHDPANLAPICGPCHDAKTQSEALAGRMKHKRKSESHPGSKG